MLTTELRGQTVLRHAGPSTPGFQSAGMTPDLKRLFGKRLATLRESKNQKQHQLGRRIGKTDKYISDIATGRIYPRPKIMAALAEALELATSNA